MERRFQRVVWHHEFDDEPVLLISEVTDDWETRKLEIFRDGRVQYAGPDGQTGDTGLGLVPMPSIEEINQDSEFTAVSIAEEDFERQWQTATHVA